MSNNFILTLFYVQLHVIKYYNVLHILRRYMFADWFLCKIILIQFGKHSFMGTFLRCDLKTLDHKNSLLKLKGITQ